MSKNIKALKMFSSINIYPFILEIVQVAILMTVIRTIDIITYNNHINYVLMVLRFIYI